MALMMIRRRPLCARARIAAMMISAFDSMGGPDLKSSRLLLAGFFLRRPIGLQSRRQFALDAGLILFVLAAGLAEAVARFEARTFAHLAF
jgi:hypothetical protein